MQGVHAILGTIGAGLENRPDQLNGRAIRFWIDMRAKCESANDREIGPISRPTHRDRFSQPIGNGTQVAITLIVHITEMVARVVIAIDVERWGEGAGVDLRCSRLA